MTTYSSNGSLTLAQMTSNAQYAMNYLMANGFTKSSAAAVIGNMQVESGVNPGRWEGGGGPGFGLVQWTPSTVLTDWANSRGLDPNAMDTQLQRILWEVANNQQWIAKPAYPMSFQQFTQSNDTPYNLAMAFCACYERPKNPYQPVRGNFAIDWYNGLTPGTPGAANLINLSSGSGGNASANSAFQNITIDGTNYEVVANSQQYGDIIYGRRYRVIVSNANGTALDVSDIRCTFNIQKTIMQQPPISEVVLYNLNADTENAIIEEGSRVVIEAGYEGTQYGVIFDGDLVQPIRDKQDATTYRLTLRSIDGDRFINYGFVGFSLIKGQTARDQVGAIASKAKYPVPLGSISENLDGTKLTRGKVMFGLAKDYLSQIAKSQNATYYIHNGTVNLIKATDYPSNTIVDLSPSSGLLDVPSQNQYGVTFTAMLNPSIQINSLVHIDNSLIRAQSFEQGQPIRNLDQDGIYRVVSVTYIGDTRGTDWKVQCDTVSQAGLLPGNANGLAQNALFNPYGSS